MYIGGRKVPIELVTKAAFEAFLKYDNEANIPNRKLREIRFLHKYDDFHVAAQKKLIECLCAYK